MRKRFDEDPVIKTALMETSSERRRRKLAELCAQRGLKPVAMRAGLSPATLDQIIKGVLLPPKRDGSRTPRSLGDEAARKIEDAESLGRGWFDESPRDDSGNVISLTDRYPNKPSRTAGIVFAGKVAPSQKVKVAGMARLCSDGFFDEIPGSDEASDGVVEALSDDPAAYALCIRGDAGFPAIRDGEYIVVEPHLKAAPTDRVVIVLRDGKTMLQELIIDRPESITVVSLDGATRRTIPRSDIRTEFGIQPITSIVSARKWSRE